MNNKELYKATFSHLHASGTDIREAKHMKKGYIRKSLLIGAAAAALMATAAGAANLATDGAFFEGVRTFIIRNYTINEDGTREFDTVDENGNEVNIRLGVFDENGNCGGDPETVQDAEWYVTTEDGQRKADVDIKDGEVVVDFAVVTDEGEVVYSRSNPEKTDAPAPEEESGAETGAGAYTVDSAQRPSAEVPDAQND